uniref:Uncharacterized protein n=1 Tax=Bursaphelenchus xylophilus TaxID=6326 RepID=A0A1I7S0F9_BURXY
MLRLWLRKTDLEVGCCELEVCLRRSDSADTLLRLLRARAGICRRGGGRGRLEEGSRVDATDDDVPSQPLCLS